MTAAMVALPRDIIARSWRLDKTRTTVAVLLIAGQVTALAMTGIAMRTVIVAALHGVPSQLFASALTAAAGLGLSWVGGSMLTLVRSDLTDRIGYLQIDPEVQLLTAELDGLEHLERADYLDRLDMLVGKGQVLAEAGWGAVEAGASACQIVVILALLAAVQPALLGLGVAALLGALLGREGGRRLRRSMLAAARAGRLERHLHEVTTRAAAGKEIRVCEAADALIGKAADAWDQTTAIRIKGRLHAALFSAAGSAVFLTGYALALTYVITLVSRHERTVADLVLVVTLAGQLRNGFGQAMRKRVQVQVGLGLAEPYRWLLDYAADQRRQSRPQQIAPSRLRDGITLRGVRFTYPGTSRSVLGPLDVHLPAGAVVALVGEYGSGKTTLVKLLCKFYSPTSGQIELDGVPLADTDTVSWRAGIAAVFQDFDRHEVRMRYAVGFGDLPAVHDDRRLMNAIRTAGAESLPDSLPRGLDAQLGSLFDGGHELSEGQWQKIALSRACVREAPLLVVLDEPSASLDPPSELATFQRHARLARRLAVQWGTITLVVSHRFSTIRIADLILVLDGGGITERGSHSELMAQGGTYAQLYRMQEAAFRTGVPSSPGGFVGT